MQQYTNKSQEAIRKAQSLAQEGGHPEITPVHLAVSLLAEPEGVSASILQKLEVEPRALGVELARQLEKLPRGSGGEVTMSPALARCLSRAGSPLPQRVKTC